jgi:capsular polysaccharide biosynthesis protein
MRCGQKKPRASRVDWAMEIVTILRGLWHRKLLVALALALAVLAGTAVAYRISPPAKLESRSYHVGVATSRIFIDTPSSQVVEVSPKGGDTLGTRAGLIASLMVDGAVKASIAHSAGLQPQQFDAVSASAAESSPAVASPKARSTVLSTTVITNAAGDELPIIQIEAQAPNAPDAAKLAAAAVTGLRDFLNSKAALQRVPDAKRLQVNGLGAPQARDVVRGPRKLMALVVAIIVFLAGCAAIVMSSTLARAWRAASEEEGAAAVPEVAPDTRVRARHARQLDEDPPGARTIVTPPPAELVHEAPSPWRR